jgi:molybdopterin-guanine dinucleotide biosynthesis protein A
MTLTATLFAGGQSRRMGRDKAVLAWAGQPLWARQLETLRQLDPSTLQVSAKSRPGWCPPEIEFVLDEPPARGPLSGLAAALRQLRTSHLLALAVDLPAMSAQHLRKLWSLAKPGIGVVPQTADCFEPLCAIYPAEAFERLGDLSSGKDHSLHSVARLLLRTGHMQVYAVAESERSLYHNLNTPEDL